MDGLSRYVSVRNTQDTAMQDSTTDDGPGYGLPRQINTLSLSLSLAGRMSVIRFVGGGSLVNLWPRVMVVVASRSGMSGWVDGWLDGLSSRFTHSSSDRVVSCALPTWKSASRGFFFQSERSLPLSHNTHLSCFSGCASMDSVWSGVCLVGLPGNGPGQVMPCPFQSAPR